MLISFLVGCVGTVEESTAPVSDTQEPVAERLGFTGVSKVKAISDTRIEIFFPVASGGSGKFVYDVYIGTDPVRSFSEEVLEKESGQYRLSISGLKVLSQVTVRVEARDKNIFGISNSNKILEVTTYATEVCQFDGISSIANMPGIAGKDQLRIQWVPGTFISTNNPANPRFYEIALVQAGRVNPDGTTPISLARDQLWNKDLTTVQGRFVYQINAIDGVNEYVVKGLTPDYNYHVGIRCIHAGTEDNPFFPELRSETNTKALTLNTLNDSLSSLNFDENSIVVSLQPGILGFTATDISWAPISGTFDHFRIYYKKKNSQANLNNISSMCNPSYDPDAVSCVLETYDKLKTTLSGLTPNEEYTYQIVICQTVSCTDPSKRRVTAAKNFITTPTIAQFSGITEATPIYSIADIGAVRLDFTKPNLSTGYIDQYVVKVKRGMDANIPWDNLGDSDPILSVDPYDVTTADHLIVRGLKLGDSSGVYCFKIEAKVGESTIQSNSSSQCLELSGNPNHDSDFRGPLISEFPGLTTLQVESGRFNLYWKKPTAGFYSQYVIRVMETTSAASIFGNSNDVTMIPLESSLYEAQLVPGVTQMQASFSVSISKSYKIAISTNFPNPFTGDLPAVINQCVWTCLAGGTSHTCTTQATCPKLEFE